MGGIRVRTGPRLRPARPRNRADFVHASEWSAENEHALVNHHVPPGKFLLRLACLPEEGIASFSELVELNAESGAPLEVSLPLQPGVRFSGTLDASVPRPVLQGHVVVSVNPIREGAVRAWPWRAEATVHADGSFVFESLPPGEVELLAYCDGFVSRNSPAPPTSQVRTPQSFPAAPAVVAMEPAATVRGRVIDRAGQPIPGGTNRLSTQCAVGRRSSGLFASFGCSTADALRLAPAEWQKRLKAPRGLARFQGATDERGAFTIANLPSGDQMYHVAAAGFEVEQSDDFGIPGLLKAHLASGRIQDLCVVMDKIRPR